MAVKLKANIGYQPIVTEVSRKFVPRKKTCKAYASKQGPVKVETTGWMGGAVRKTHRGIFGACERNYLVIRENARSSAPSSAELQSRMLFKTVQSAVNDLLIDLTQMSRIQVMFTGGTHGGTTYEGAANNASIRVNGVSAKGYTLKGWVFAVQYAGKKESASYDVNTFPSAYDA